MRILVDTHVWLWMLSNSSLIPVRTKAVLADADIVVSAATTWEIAIKYELGKLDLPEPPATFIPDRLLTSDSISTPITVEQSLVAGSLPPHHRDPFDRMLIAQANVLGVPLCSGDRVFDQYDVNLLWS